MIDATRKTYFSPDDALDQALLDLVKSATSSIRIADYSFNLIPLVDDLIAKHEAGVDVKLVLDRSQAGGKTERLQLNRLEQAGVPFVEGTSEKHRIMHNKFCVVDNEWVLAGSYNFTSLAESENNYFDIEHSPERAQVFLTQWQKLWDWIEQNEPQ